MPPAIPYQVRMALKAAGKRMGAHAAGGAAIGAYTSHRSEKTQKKSKKGRLGRIAEGALGGAALGAGLGYAHTSITPVLHEPVIDTLKGKFKERGIRFHDVHRAVGTAGGALAGGVASYRAAKDAKKRGAKGADPRAAAVIGAGLGASAGHSLGSWARMGHIQFAAKKADKLQAASVGSVKVPEWLKGAKTKSEAKKAYYSQMKKHHTDTGGSKEQAQRVNKEWSDFEKAHLHKLGHIAAAFFNELCQIEG